MSGKEGQSPPADLMRAAVEAVIFAADEPVKPSEIAEVFGEAREEEIREALEALADSYDEREAGLVLEKVAGGYRIVTRSNVGPWVRGFFRQRHRTRLSPAGLETLAIVAYRQPVTGPEIQSIRGVDPSGALRSLLEKKMIRILGRKKVVGNPFLYGTTNQFLMHFGLDSLEDLPSIEEFEELVEGLEHGSDGRTTPDSGGVAVAAGPDAERDPEVDGDG